MTVDANAVRRGIAAALWVIYDATPPGLLPLAVAHDEGDADGLLLSPRSSVVVTPDLRFASMVGGFATPEEAVRADESMPPQYAKIVAVEHSPDERYAVVCVEYNEPPMVEPYVIVCDKGPEGWEQGHGGSGGGLSWMSTSEDGSIGVEVEWWGRAPTVRWDVRSPEERRPQPGDLAW